MRLQPPGPLRARRLRDEPPDPRLPELRFTPVPTCVLRAGAASPARQLTAATPALWTGPTPSDCQSPPFPGSTGRRGCRSSGAQEAGGPPSWSKCQDPSGTTLSSPLLGAPASGGAHSCRQTPGWSCAPSVLHQHNSNSTLSIKVSKLAQAPPPPHSPELQCAQGPALAGRSDFGSGGAPLAHPGSWTRTPEGRPGHLQIVTTPVSPGPPSEASSP